MFYIYIYYMVVILFTTVIYVFLLLYLRILIVFSFIFIYLHRASWHSSATLTEVLFRAFPSVVRQMAGDNLQRRGTARTVPKLLCCYVYCLCVNVYCTAATGWLPSCS